jgi:hypothetical protein
MIPGERFPRDKDELIREVDARLRIGDIRRSHQLKDRLAPKWWEAAIVMLLFASALGLLASLFQYADLNDKPLNKWMLFWFGLTILTIVMSFEFLLIKIYNLRRSNDVMLHMIEDLRKQTENLEQTLHANQDKGPTESSHQKENH